MKKILVVEDDMHVNKMYKEFFLNEFEDVDVVQCHMMSEVHEQLNSNFDLYLLDGQIIGGHTSSFIDTLPKDKVVVVSASDDYAKEVKSKEIVFFFKPFSRLHLKENKKLFETILNQ